MNGSRAAEKPKKGIYKMKIVAFTQSEANGTFAQDVPLFADAIKASGADIVLAPATSRFKRSMPAAAIRAGADIDTNVTDVTIEGDAVIALMSLGFSRQDSDRALKSAMERGADTIESIITIALQTIK